MGFLLQILSLADRYERKARLLPGLIVAFPLALGGGFVLSSAAEWPSAVTSGAVIELLAAFVFGQLARARGRRLEETLWAEWGGPPTTRWLRPNDSTCSEQQKSKWRSAIRTLTGLTIPATVTAERTAEQVDRVVVDAVRQLRRTLPSLPTSCLLNTHNEEYGFARNLFALRWHWVGASAASLALLVVTAVLGHPSYPGLLAAVVTVVVAALLSRELKTYVRHCADRYADSFFTAVVSAARTVESGLPPGAGNADSAPVLK